MSAMSAVQEAMLVLAELDALAQSAQFQNNRRSQRVPYRRQLRLKRREGQASAESWVFARDLSVGGMGCLQLEPVAAGTPVLIHLPAIDRSIDEIAARVAYCRPVKGQWHLMGLLFDRAIEPDRYLMAA